MRGGGHDLFVFGPLGHLVGFGHSVARRPDDGVGADVGDLFAEHVDGEIELLQALFILFRGHHGVFLLSNKPSNPYSYSNPP